MQSETGGGFNTWREENERLIVDLRIERKNPMSCREPAAVVSMKLRLVPINVSVRMATQFTESDEA